MTTAIIPLPTNSPIFVQNLYPGIKSAVVKNTLVAKYTPTKGLPATTDSMELYENYSFDLPADQPPSSTVGYSFYTPVLKVRGKFLLPVAPSSANYTAITTTTTGLFPIIGMPASEVTIPFYKVSDKHNFEIT